MALLRATLTAEDLDLGVEDEETVDVLDLPQLYTCPNAKTLQAVLQELSSAPPSWEATPRTRAPRSVSGASTPLRKKRRIRSDGVPAYLTKIISSPLSWIENDAEKEQIWEAASVRLSERSGRTAMSAITRTFAIPLNPAVAEVTDGKGDGNMLEITLHEPTLTADNLGLKTWASSYLLAKRMVLLKDALPLKPDAKVLELGAGTGLVGLTAAAVLQREVVLTDLSEIVLNLEKNATSNSTVISACGGRVSTVVLDWSAPSLFFPSNPDPCPPHSFPLILAADPIYSPEHPDLLVNAIAQHLSRDKAARVVVEMPIREAYSAEREDFCDRMTEMGLAIVEDGEEVGYDDWAAAGRGEEELMEVMCWWSVWGWIR